MHWRERRRLNGKQWPSAWVKGLADDAAPGRTLAPLIDACHRAVVAPYWGNIQRHLALEVARHSHAVATSGVEALFDSLHPTARWDSPALELPSHPGRSVDVYLNGRGIDLVPIVFLSTIEGPFWRVDDPGASAVLFYPAVRNLAHGAKIFTTSVESTTNGDGGGDRPLAELLGRTRAAALTAIDGGCTTTALARQVGISIAGASQHARVLRRSGLITTVRDGSSVVHNLTALGRSLLAESTVAETDARGADHPFSPGLTTYHG